LALSKLCSANGRLPAGMHKYEAILSPHVMLLPYLELSSTFEGFDLNTHSYVEPNATYSRIQPKAFICPSDPFPDRTQSMGWTNYLSNSGSWVVVTKSWDGVFGPAYDGYGDAAAKALKPITFSAITDGLSNTCLFAEVSLGSGYSGAAKNKSDVYEGTTSTTDLVSARNGYLAKDWRNENIADGNWRWRGYPWSEGSVWRNWYNHLLPPNQPAWRPGDYAKIVSPTSSYHAGGAQAVKCDGSVALFSSSIDGNVWTALGTRNGGETVNLD
jgi:hypothetical protein